MLHFVRDDITPRKTQSTMQSIVIDENTQLNELNQEADNLADINPVAPSSANPVNLNKVDNPPSIK